MSSARPTNVVNARRRLVGAAARAVGDVVDRRPDGDIGGRGRLERRILGEDRGLQPAQVGAGLEPELVGQEVPGVGVGAQRFCLPARAVEGEHQLSAQALSEGSASDRGVELGDEVGVAAHRQQGVETILGDRLAQLLPPTRRGDRHRHVDELDQRSVAPQTERAFEAGDGRARPAAGERLPALPRQPFEAERVDVVVGNVEEVAGRAGHDPVGTDRLADLEDDHLEGVRRLLQIPLGPQALDQSVGGRRHSRPQREQGEERALTEPDERDRLTTLVAHVERSEQTDLHDQKLPASQVAHPPPVLSASDCQGRNLKQTERWG